MAEGGRGFGRLGGCCGCGGSVEQSVPVMGLLWYSNVVAASFTMGSECVIHEGRGM